MRLTPGLHTSRLAVIVALLAGAAAPLRAQTAPAAEPPAPAAPAPAPAPAPSPTIEEQLKAMQAKLDAQQAEIEALRASVAAGGSDSATEAELEATLQALGDETDEDVSRFESAEPISIYGYLDIGYQRLFAPSHNPIRNLVGSDEGTFLLGNVNFYFDVTPDPDWRSLTEIRFTNLPHGAESIGVRGSKDYAQVDNVALNQTSPDGRDRVLLGNIILERAWIQWQRYPLLNIRVGQWLTPFGIWNVDHGAPVLITVTQPDFQLSESFPSRQTGIQLVGEAPVGSLELVYSAYLSNGRTKGLVDLSDDKAIGGRLVLQKPGADSIAVGTSVYYGTYQEQEKYLLRVEPDFRVGRFTVVDLREIVFGLDFALDSGPFRFRTEGVVRRVDYEPGKHEAPNHGQPGALEPNHFYSAGYVIFAYRLPWLGLEPTFQFEAMHRPAAFGDTIVSTTPGFNIHFAPTVQLKSSFGHVAFLDLTKGDGRSDYQYMLNLNSRMVMAF